MIEELSRMVWIFARFQDNPLKEAAKEQGWTLETISRIQSKVQASTNMADRIKEELIGDGDEVKFVGRTKTAFFELNSKPTFAPSYFPEFDEACFELPSKEHPNRNKELADALLLVYRDEAGLIMLRLRETFKMANFIVQDVCSMLDEVCKFVGYTPELQEQTQEATNTDSLAVEQPEPQQTTQELATPEAKELIYKAIAANLIEKTPEGLKWKGTKVLCAYFADRASHSLNLSNKMDKEGNITTSWKPFEALFGIDRLKDAKQNWMRLNTKFEPTGYEKVDALM